MTRATVEQAEDAELRRDHAGARAAYERAVAQAPDARSQIFARREYASSLESWGEVPGAIAQLEAIVKLDPQHAPSWHDLGILRHVQGDDAGAAIALRRAEALVPDDPRPRIALAALLWKTGDLAGAAAEYRVLLTLELPVRVREKVEWALREIERAPGSGRRAPGPDPERTPSAASPRPSPSPEPGARSPEPDGSGGAAPRPAP